jgi:hypothetical protein
MYVCIYKVADVVQEFSFWTPKPNLMCLWFACQSKLQKALQKARVQHISQGMEAHGLKDKFQNTHPVGRNWAPAHSTQQQNES